MLLWSVFYAIYSVYFFNQCCFPFLHVHKGVFHEGGNLLEKPRRAPHTNFKLRVRKNEPKNFQLRLRRNPNFQLRVRKESPNFQLRVRKSPNFQLRVRKSPNFQLRVRKNPNFQLRLKKRAGGDAFQLRVRKEFQPNRQSRNFQLRVRKADLDYERMLREDQTLLDGMTRNLRNPNGFQLRVRRAPSSFQLRVRKDGSVTSNDVNEEQYLYNLSEADLDNYAKTLPTMDLPAFIQAARKRSAGNFQLRV